MRILFFFRPSGDEIFSVVVTYIRTQDLVPLIESHMVSSVAANLAPDGETTLSGFFEKIVSRMESEKQNREPYRWN